MNSRGEQIFDLLLKNRALTRKELARALGISDTGAYFSYALQQLKDLGYAENIRGEGKGNKVSLTDKAFVSSRDEFEATSKCESAAESDKVAPKDMVVEETQSTDDDKKKEKKTKKQKVAK